MKILVIEDEGRVATLIKKGLEEMGFAVTIAGVDARAFVTQQRRRPTRRLTNWFASRPGGHKWAGSARLG